MITIMMNGPCQPSFEARYRPSGRPMTWLAAKALWTVPITRPRACSGKRSATMAMLSEPMTPPKSPVTMRAASNAG